MFNEYEVAPALLLKIPEKVCWLLYIAVSLMARISKITRGSVMAIDLRKFFEATGPSRTLVVNHPEDRKYYIDFSNDLGAVNVRLRYEKNIFLVI